MATSVSSYFGLEVNLRELTQSIENAFASEQYDVLLLNCRNDDSQFSSTIQIQKNSKLRKIIGTRKKAIVKIEGRSNNFKITVIEEDIGKNVLSSTVTSLPANIITLGIPIPTAIAVTANLCSKKRFKNYLWKIIYREIQDNTNVNSLEI